MKRDREGMKCYLKTKGKEGARLESGDRKYSKKYNCKRLLCYTLK
jgi:hypothetical protein